MLVVLVITMVIFIVVVVLRRVTSEVFLVVHMFPGDITVVVMSPEKFTWPLVRVLDLFVGATLRTTSEVTMRMTMALVMV